MLGPLLVRRSDGHFVAAHEWRTHRTTELLCLLALSPGSVVDTDELLGELWPEVPDDRARASLRTAAYQLRKVLGQHHVVRSAAGLSLEDAWVDADAFAVVVAEAAAAFEDDRHADVVRLVRSAEALYADDLDCRHAGPRLTSAARQWRSWRGRALAQGAESALAQGWIRDADQLARAAHDLDPHSERSARVLMQTNAALGEVESALAVYQQVCTDLRTTLGADPSPQTRAVHLQVLHGMAAGPEPDVTDCGPVAEMARALTTALAAGGGLVVVSGEHGSGRERYAASAAARIGSELWPCASGTLSLLARPHDGSTPVALLPEVPEPSRTELARWATRARAHGAVLVLPVHRTPPGTDPAWRHAGAPVLTVDVPPLDARQLDCVARRVLQGPPAVSLVDELRRVTDGRAGDAIDRLRSWLQAGEVAWTAAGLVHCTTGPGPGLRMGSLLQQRLRGMAEPVVDVLCVLSLCETALTSPQLEAVIVRAMERRVAPGEVTAALERLVDQGLVGVTRSGFVLRNPAHRPDLAGWMRPMTAIQVHVAVVDEVALDDLERARHLLAAGVYAEERVTPAADATPRRHRLARPMLALSGLPVVQRLLQDPAEMAVLERVLLA